EVARSTDGWTVLTGTGGGVLCLWDLAAGRPVGQLSTGCNGLEAVAISPDGRTVLSASRGWDQSQRIRGNGTVRFWNARTWKPVGAALKHPADVQAAAFSPDGRRVVTGCKDGTARLWDSATGKPLGVTFQHQGPVSSVAFSADGKMILTSTSGVF